ncbi:MAG: substrate-binding domain-containing protein [Bryobacteraceae bacterium]
MNTTLTTRRGALAAMAGAAAACNRSQKKAIAVIPKGNAHLFWQSVHAGAVAAAREENLDVIWNGPATESDFTGQIKIVESMINRRVDAIALAPIDRKAMVSVVERAAREGVPLIIFDSGIDTEQYVAQIATDNYRAGELAAERMTKILNGEGRVGIIAVMPGAASTLAREAGFEDWIRKNAPKIEIVDKQFGMAEVATSLSKAENMLTAHPKLAGLFASNESSAVGAAQALKGREGKVKLVGFDSSPTLIDGLKAGQVDSLVIQDPFKMGYESVKTAAKKIASQPVEKVQNLAARLVTLENVNAPDVQAQLNPDLKKYLD